MKNVFPLFALFIFASFLLLSGCKKDEEAGPDTQKLLVGNWQFENYQYTELANGQSTEDKYTGKGETVEFKSDGNVVFKDAANKTEEGKWSLSGDKKKVSLDFANTPDIFDQSTMNLYYNFEVKEISSGKLVLFYTSTISTGGQPYKEEFTINFKK